MAIVINGSTGISATESSSVLGDGAVEIADISATGTPSSSNYLRGDGSWQTVASYTDTDALDLFNASGSAPVYACRAWVNFDAQSTGTPVISSSGNVSSITDSDVGKFVVNFTTGFSSIPSATGGMTIVNYPGVMRVNPSTGNCQIFCSESYGGTYRDPSRCSIQVFGN